MQQIQEKTAEVERLFRMLCALGDFGGTLVLGFPDKHGDDWLYCRTFNKQKLDRPEVTKLNALSKVGELLAYGKDGVTPIYDPQKMRVTGRQGGVRVSFTHDGLQSVASAFSGLSQEFDRALAALALYRFQREWEINHYCRALIPEKHSDGILELVKDAITGEPAILYEQIDGSKSHFFPAYDAGKNLAQLVEIRTVSREPVSNMIGVHIYTPAAPECLEFLAHAMGLDRPFLMKDEPTGLLGYVETRSHEAKKIFRIWVRAERWIPPGVSAVHS